MKGSCKNSSVRNNNYNRDFICEVCHVNEYSFLAIYLTTVKGVSAGMTGAIIGMSALVGVFASFIGGNLSDRFGRNTIIIWSMIAWVFVLIDSIAVSHLKGTYFGAMGFSGIGTVIGPWFGEYSSITTGTKMDLVSFQR